MWFMMRKTISRLLEKFLYRSTYDTIYINNIKHDLIKFITTERFPTSHKSTVLNEVFSIMLDEFK